MKFQMLLASIVVGAMASLSLVSSAEEIDPRKFTTQSIGRYVLNDSQTEVVGLGDFYRVNHFFAQIENTTVCPPGRLCNTIVEFWINGAKRGDCVIPGINPMPPPPSRPVPAPRPRPRRADPTCYVEVDRTTDEITVRNLGGGDLIVHQMQVKRSRKAIRSDLDWRNEANGGSGREQLNDTQNLAAQVIYYIEELEEGVSKPQYVDYLQPIKTAARLLHATATANGSSHETTLLTASLLKNLLEGLIALPPDQPGTQSQEFFQELVERDSETKMAEAVEGMILIRFALK